VAKADEAVRHQADSEASSLTTLSSEEQRFVLPLHAMEAMGGHAIEPLDSLSLELPNGEIVVGYDKDIAALQGPTSRISFL
jgi:hypothetical protein